MEVIITGAERLPPELAESFEQRFGIRPVEGYGVTEASPVVSANIPANRARARRAIGPRRGPSAGLCPA